MGDGPIAIGPYGRMFALASLTHSCTPPSFISDQTVSNGIPLLILSYGPMPALPDFSTPDDLRPVVEEFYATIRDDPSLGPFFAEVDLAAHVEILVGFWTNVVFGEAVYRGRPFEKHLNFAFPLSPATFGVWVARLERCVDAHAAGPRAERMKASARQIATVFQLRLGLLDPEHGLPVMREA